MPELAPLYRQITVLNTLWQAPWTVLIQELSLTIRNLLQASDATIWTINQHDLTLELQYRLDNTRHPAAAHRKLSQFPLYFDALNKHDLLSLDSVNDEALVQGIFDQDISFDREISELHIPLSYEKKLLGVLCIDNFPKQVSPPQDLAHFLQALGALLSQRLSHDKIQQNQLTNQELNRKLQATFDNAGEGILLMQNEYFIDCNQAILKMFRCNKEQIMQRTPMYYSPEFQPDGQLSQDKAMQRIKAVFDGQVQCFEWQHKRHDGTLFDAEVTLTVVNLEQEPLVHAIVRDITERKLAERQLQQSKNLLIAQNQNLSLLNALSIKLHSSTSVKTIIDETLDILLELLNTPYIAIYLLDDNKQYLKLASSHGFNDHILQVGQRIPLSGGLNVRALQQGHLLVTSDIAGDPQANPDLKALVETINVNSGAFIPLIYRNEPLGSLCLLYKENYIFDEAEKDTFDTIGKNISLSIINARHMQKLEYMAHHDSLTGLPNRALLHHEFENNIACGPGMPAVLMLIDLDRFKDINDTLGHYVGDLLLQQISPRISQCTQNYKTLICRLGGDEFTVLIYGRPKQDEVIQLANDILNSLRQPINIDSMLLEIDASIGVALYPQDGKDSHALLRSADVAMYDAKKRGSGVTLYNRKKDIHTPERLTLMAELGGAIRDDQLVLHYQPKVDLQHNRITGFEALVRWDHPLSGLLYPDKFIPLAEVSDAIHHLTEKVLDMALSQQQIWRQQGNEYSVAVNLSARNLVDDRCVNSLKSKLQQYQTPAGMLELELTETALMQDPEKAVDLLMQLSQLGVKLSIDDFGTGYSSLSYLRQLPIDTLKIDRYFVNEMLKNEQDIIIVRSTISLGHNLNLKVIAEGVEDHETMSALRKMNCDIAQGYHISRPLSWPDMQQWLKQINSN